MSKDHRAEVAVVPETTGTALHVLDDGVEPLKDGVGVFEAPVVEDLRQMGFQHLGERFHPWNVAVHDPGDEFSKPSFASS